MEIMEENITLWQLCWTRRLQSVCSGGAASGTKEIRWLKNGLNGNVVVNGSRTTRVITTHGVTHAVVEQSTTSTVVWNASTELLPDVRGQARNLKKLASTRSHGIPMGRPTVPARDLNFGRRVST